MYKEKRAWNKKINKQVRKEKIIKCARLFDLAWNIRFAKWVAKGMHLKRI